MRKLAQIFSNKNAFSTKLTKLGREKVFCVVGSVLLSTFVTK